MIKAAARCHSTAALPKFLLLLLLTAVELEQHILGQR
jgi:hypothetical protein